MNRIMGLDTLRFFAFLAIFIFHATPHFEYGYLGVDFFFVLSSFLLTYLAYTEISDKGIFNKVNFFGRRIIRIFPLYYLILILSFFIIPMIDSSTSLPNNQLLYWLFLSNYETSDSIYALKFLWSISVEEQFYLLFIGLSILLKRKLLLIIVFLLFSYFSFIILANLYNIPTYSNTITHFPNFAAGILGGYIYFNKKQNPTLNFVLFVISLIVNFTIQSEIILHLNISVFFLTLIFLVTQHSAIFNDFFILKLTEKLGRYTYGLYVYSGFILTIVPKLFNLNNTYYNFIIEMSFLLFISIISYHLFEKHFIKLKKYFR